MKKAIDREKSLQVLANNLKIESSLLQIKIRNSNHCKPNTKLKVPCNVLK